MPTTAAFAYTKTMIMLNGASLAEYSTMRLGGPAAHLLEITDASQLPGTLGWAQAQNMPVIMIGGGSNIIWRDEGFPGLVLVNKIAGYEVFEEDETNVYVTIGGGENWDAIVARTVEAGLTGVESLSLIPGSSAATPVQNVGAYGQEIAQTLTSLQAFDTVSGELVNIPAADCAFGYRTSRFKTTDRGRYFITAITLHLMRGNPQPPYYPALQSYLEEHNISDPTPSDVRAAVIEIRQSKLPDPAVVANNGSFFANPVISATQLTRMQADTDLTPPQWPTPEGLIKISAAWLVEQAGFKDFHDAETGMATWSKQPLVLVNEQATSTAQLLAFKQKIVDAVHTKFGITLEQEPELLPY